MATTRTNHTTTKAGRRRGPGREAQRKLLVVEPEALLRWSLSTYLSRWFRVFAVESSTAADRVLNRRRIDAAVVSEDLPNHEADVVETHVRNANTQARIIRTASSPIEGRSEGAAVGRIEKPFKLSELASLLSAPMPNEPD